MSLEIHPDLDGFLTAGAARRVVSVHTRLLAGDLTAVGIYRALCGERTNTFLLESAELGQRSRYSFIGVNAAATLTETNGRAVWRWNGPVIAGLSTDVDPLVALAETLKELATPRDSSLPPLVSGMVGYLGYDVVRRLERLPDSNPNDLGVPELAMMLARDLAILDHQAGEVWLVSNALNFDDSPARAEQAYSAAAQRIVAMEADLQRPAHPVSNAAPEQAAGLDSLAVGGSIRPAGVDRSQVRRQRTKTEYEAVVAAAISEIRAGEAFQIVPSQRFEIDCDADALAVYQVLRHRNPSPYLYLLRLEDFAIVGASPEALVTVTERSATTHPIAGTRPRGRDLAADLDFEAELLADPKEAAEHLMLVDLGRNDLGRVCVPGSVAVTGFMKVRRYSQVMHLEAAVTGGLLPECTALEATLSCFPAGTLTGAPKVRAMEIIDSLEVSRRGLYGGAVGYFDFAGDSDTAIAIRTAVIRDQVAYVQAGAGVVADSIPASEDAESRDKAGAVLAAVAEAVVLGRRA